MISEVMLRIAIEALNHPDYRDGKDEFGEEIREIAESLYPHFSEHYPEHLLEHQHPGEESWAKAYRDKRWTSVTMMCTGRVYTTLQKISQADDWKIRFNENVAETGVTEENSLSKYVEGSVPKFGKLSAWLFGPFLKEYLKDPNAVVLFLPNLEEIKKNPENPVFDPKFPYPQIFCSEDIVYKRDDMIVVRFGKWKDKEQVKWDQFLAVDKNGFALIRQTKAYKYDEDVFVYYNYEFESPVLPVVDVGFIIKEIEEGQRVYDSILSPCLPAWDEVLYRHSDLIINWAMHGNPQKWRIGGQKCKTCRGTGFSVNNKNEQTKCGDCNGTGQSEGSPFTEIVINAQVPNALNPSVATVPTPPAGYVTRDTESLKAQKEDIENNIFRGFQAIGLELLSVVPAAQSGLAKQYDRKEINTFFYQVAVHLASVYIRSSMIMYGQRLIALGIIGENTGFTDEKFLAAKPVITVPTDFDILSAEMIADQLGKALKDGFNPVIVKGLEYDYTEKIYGTDSMQLKLMKALTALDPLPNKTVDEKVVTRDSGGCSALDFILSTYLELFVNELMEENPDWINKPRTEQRKDLNAKAVEKQKQVTAGIVPLVEFV